MKGPRNEKTRLWDVPLTSEGEDNRNAVPTFKGENKGYQQGNNLHRINKMEDVMQFLHAYLFSLKLQTLLQAVKNNNLITWPGLTVKNIKRYMKETIATAKGHLD